MLNFIPLIISKEVVIAVSYKVSDTFNKIFMVNCANFNYSDAFLGYTNYLKAPQEII